MSQALSAAVMTLAYFFLSAFDELNFLRRTARRCRLLINNRFLAFLAFALLG